MAGADEPITTPWQLPSDVATVFHNSVILNEEGMETIPGLFFEGQLSRVCKANRAFVRARQSIFDGSVFLNPYDPLDATPEGIPSFVNGGHEIKLSPTHSFANDRNTQPVSRSLLIVRDKLTRQVYFLLVTEDDHANVPFKWAVHCKYNMTDCLRILGCHHVRESEILKPVNHKDDVVTTPGRLNFLTMSTMRRELRELSWEDVCYNNGTRFRSTSMSAHRAADGSSALRLHHRSQNSMKFRIDETRLTVMVPVDEDTDVNGIVPDADETVYWIDGEPFKKHQFSKYTVTNGISIYDDTLARWFDTRSSDLTKYSELCLRFGVLDVPEIGWCNGLVDHDLHPNRYDLIKKHVPKQLWPPRPMPVYRFMWEQKLYETRRDLAEKETRKAKRMAEEKVEETRRNEECTSYWGRWKKRKYAASESSCSNAAEDEECIEAREYERNNEGMLDDRVGNSSESEKEEGIRSDDHSDSDYEYKGVFKKKKRKQKKQKREKKHVSTKKQGKQAIPKPSGLLTDRMKKMLYPVGISDSSETE